MLMDFTTTTQLPSDEILELIAQSYASDNILNNKINERALTSSATMTQRHLRRVASPSLGRPF